MNVRLNSSKDLACVAQSLTFSKILLVFHKAMAKEGRSG
ncbi:unnamed protein product [Trifolium pratense]|uniref:Uncharacterized protein n=1 Tax=Trifolium pratense TaxID=57577 RepID=A0ACB0J8K8_TRIPR|nr:unnamed protein product [Trifolium pratense]